MDKQPKIFPPVYFLIYFISAILLDRFIPVVRLGSVPWFGAVVALAGIASGGWAVFHFRKNKTTHKPFAKSRVLVEEGPYGYTRNPMYLGFTLVLLGEAIYLGSLSAFLSPVIMYYTMDSKIIPLEEQLLADTFKEQYKKYQDRVRRWI